MTPLYIVSVLAIGVAGLCWAFTRRQRTVLNYLNDEQDWGAQ